MRMFSAKIEVKKNTVAPFFSRGWGSAIHPETNAKMLFRHQSGEAVVIEIMSRSTDGSDDVKKTIEDLNARENA